tara:strand:- start:1108 stop:1248 length:141 start_codon:yes stop_codon:yes gene_type:complete
MKQLFAKLFRKTPDHRATMYRLYGYPISVDEVWNDRDALAIAGLPQ